MDSTQNTTLGIFLGRVHSSPVQSTLDYSNYGDVIYHSKAFFKLSLKMLAIADYSDVIYHSIAFFKLSLKMLVLQIIVMLFTILQHFQAEFENVSYCRL